MNPNGADTQFINFLISMGFTAVYCSINDNLATQKLYEARVYMDKQNGNDVTSVVVVGDLDMDDVTFTFINGKAVRRDTPPSA